MATRPVFIINNKPPYFKKIDVEFQYASGFAISQKQKNIKSLHSAFLSNHSKYKILEISTKSAEYLGQQLSAFNLSLNIKNKEYSVETLFQSSKIYDTYYKQSSLLQMTSIEAKKYGTSNNDKKLLGFKFLDINFPLEPKTYFYDWLYINALYGKKNLIQQLLDSGYNAFSDIEFNPKKSINCQAQSVAIAVSLVKLNKLSSLYKNNEINKDDFLKTVYNKQFNIHEENIIEIIEKLE